MKKLITSIWILCCSSVIFGQTTTEDDYFSKPKTRAADKISTSLIAGTGVSFLNSSKSPVYTTYISPKIAYQISPKFNLDMGLMHYSASENSFIQLNKNEFILNTSNRTVTGNLVFVGGDYQLNPRLVMTGAVMMDARDLSNRQNNYKAASLGLDYKISEHSSIGISASISTGNGDYYINSRTGKYGYNPNIPNTVESLFLSPMTQWGMEKNMIPIIR